MLVSNSQSSFNRFMLERFAILSSPLLVIGAQQTIREDLLVSRAIPVCQCTTPSLQDHLAASRHSTALSARALDSTPSTMRRASSLSPDFGERVLLYKRFRRCFEVVQKVHTISLSHLLLPTGCRPSAGHGLRRRRGSRKSSGWRLPSLVVEGGGGRGSRRESWGRRRT